MQDATFIETDPGKHGKKRPPVDPIPSELRDVTPEKMTTKVGKREAKIRTSEKKRLRREERRSARTRRSKNGTWTKKNSASHFGNKLHTVQGTDIPLIREFVVTTASLHDSQVDLSIPGIPCYRDKGYSGAQCRGINAAMDKAARNHTLTVDKIRRNLRVTRKRSPGERPYSVIKGVMHGRHTFVSTIRRYRVKAMFLCLGYNALTMITLKKQGKIA
nr:transposase [Ferroplasma sp.]